MGAICSRKNQLFAIQAYNLLPKKIRAASKLMLVGTPLDEKDPYYIEFLRVVKQYPEIDYIPRVERSEIPALYRQINALICCSIDDPLPVVVTECFMFGKNVIISSGSFDCKYGGLVDYKCIGSLCGNVVMWNCCKRNLFSCI